MVHWIPRLVWEVRPSWRSASQLCISTTSTRSGSTMLFSPTFMNSLSHLIVLRCEGNLSSRKPTSRPAHQSTRHSCPNTTKEMTATTASPTSQAWTTSSPAWRNSRAWTTSRFTQPPPINVTRYGHDAICTTFQILHGFFILDAD